MMASNSVAREDCEYPQVIVHTAVSADGRIDHIAPDLGKFYGLAQRWHEDVTLVGSDTALAAPVDAHGDEGEALGPPSSDDKRPWLAVVDSRGRVQNYRGLMGVGYWRGAIAMCSRATPAEHTSLVESRGVQTIVAGELRVDLKAALSVLARQHGAKVVRVDSGGTLSGALLRAGLVTEVSVLIHPVLVGGTSPRSFFRAPDLDGPAGIISAQLVSMEDVGDGVVWLRFKVAER